LKKQELPPENHVTYSTDSIIKARSRRGALHIPVAAKKTRGKKIQIQSVGVIFVNYRRWGMRESGKTA
jgi:hypothetical protein